MKGSRTTAFLLGNYSPRKFQLSVQNFDNGFPWSYQETWSLSWFCLTVSSPIVVYQNVASLEFLHRFSLYVWRRRSLCAEENFFLAELPNALTRCSTADSEDAFLRYLLDTQPFFLWSLGCILPFLLEFQTSIISSPNPKSAQICEVSQSTLESLLVFFVPKRYDALLCPAYFVTSHEAFLSFFHYYSGYEKKSRSL